MAQFIDFQPSDFFNAMGYIGTGATNAVTGVGFQPDMVWQKNCGTAGDHTLTDAVRGVDKQLIPNGEDEEQAYSNALTAFGADGFTVGDNALVNENTKSIMSWNWKAGTTAVPSGGSITPSACSFNTTSGFGMYKFTGTGANATIAHGLGKIPRFIIVKRIDPAEAWTCYHRSLGNNRYMILNAGGSNTTDSTVWNDTDPTSTLFSLGSSGYTNSSGNEMIAYVWCDITGYSKFGQYDGNGNADGPFISLGFRPAYFLFKGYESAARQWTLMDMSRAQESTIPTADMNTWGGELYADTNAAIGWSAPPEDLYANSNGIKMIRTHNYYNQADYGYIYAAFAQFPFVSSNDIPTVAR